ncbi:uncharacterized protein B0P05DRAFT_554921 [Gilbertella persicaria]|uniref:uncharacterized protein n=1 Tax=Gilbertella persicaria TaxID=101096 RepID=UPI00221EF5CE|nr:uncharacterized protein B0P05DRAFT_554921 [Gilbertella persicaria]KAI8064310.1 hypothetical protein B0P05DRAFT_554921 [Gilbertella persicaria]
MLQSHVINVLPRRLLASFWATPETRISLSHLMKPLDSQQPAAIEPSFLCNELPVRYTHILRLLSTLSHESLQSPIIRNVAHSYLRDICTLLHPSLKQTSPKAFSKVLTKLRQSQALNLIRLKYALLSKPLATSVSLLENINIIHTGIHLLLDQHLSWDTNHAQKVCPETIANQAVDDAKKTLLDALGAHTTLPEIEIKRDTMINKRCSQESEREFVFLPNLLHRILYESTLLSLKAQAMQNEETDSKLNWFQRQWKGKHRPLSLRIFGGPTSVGFRLDSAASLHDHDLLPSIPRDILGIPVCGSVLSQTSANKVNDETLRHPEMVEWASMSGWRSAKTLARHWGGNLDAVSVEGLGSTIYLALDRDPTLPEHYPSRISLAASAHSLLRHHRRTSAAVASADHTLSIQAAATQLDAFLYAISDSQQSTFVNPNPLYHHHSVSLTAAVGHA